MTLSDIERLGAASADATDALQMDEDTFRAFYDRTARGVWAYLSRTTGDPRLADDLLQETYYRFLRASGSYGRCASAQLLFRIATNLVHDHRRRARALRGRGRSIRPRRTRPGTWSPARRVGSISGARWIASPASATVAGLRARILSRRLRPRLTETEDQGIRAGRADDWHRC
jgi:DNA-directed RNA polymerase specialized sigma24 family protein